MSISALVKATESLKKRSAVMIKTAIVIKSETTVSPKADLPAL